MRKRGKKSKKGNKKICRFLFTFSFSSSSSFSLCLFLLEIEDRCGGFLSVAPFVWGERGKGEAGERASPAARWGAGISCGVGLNRMEQLVNFVIRPPRWSITGLLNCSHPPISVAQFPVRCLPPPFARSTGCRPVAADYAWAGLALFSLASQALIRGLVFVWPLSASKSCFLGVFQKSISCSSGPKINKWTHTHTHTQSPQ